MTDQSVFVSNYPIPNTYRIRTVRVPLTVALSPVRLPDMEIIDGLNLLIKADPSNPIGSFVLIGGTPAETRSRDMSYPLVPNEAVPFRVSNASDLYASTTLVGAGCWVIISAEQRRV